MRRPRKPIGNCANSSSPTRRQGGFETRPYKKGPAPPLQRMQRCRRVRYRAAGSGEPNPSEIPSRDTRAQHRRHPRGATELLLMVSACRFLGRPYCRVPRYPLSCATDRPMEPKSADRWGATLNAARTAARYCDEKIGWNRVGMLLSIAIIAIAIIALLRILKDIDLEEVLDALRASDPRDIALAALFVAAGYFTLTFYDLFALHTIGRADVPYRVAALAGFTSYSIGHNVGATVFTGGAVRYRIYSAWGLDAIEVAKLCFVAGLTFWLGNATVLGLGILYTPRSASAIDQLPIWFNRVAAVAIIVALASYIVWVWKTPRRIGHG